MTWCVARGDLACYVSYRGLISLLRPNPPSSTQRLSWSSSSIWRGWHGRALTWRHTLAGCMQLRLGTPLSFFSEPVSQNCSLLWSRCLAVREALSVARHTLEGSSFPGWGCGAAAVSSSHLMCSRGTLGTITTSIKRSWTFSFLRLTPARPLHLTSCLKRCTAYSRCVAGDAGQLGLGELFENWRTWEQCFPERGFPARFVDPLPSSN